MVRKVGEKTVNMKKSRKDSKGMIDARGT